MNRLCALLVVLAGAALPLAALGALGAGSAGVSRPLANPVVINAPDSASVYAALEGLGLHGRKVLVASAVLHYVPIETGQEAVGAGRGFPLKLYSLAEYYRTKLARANYLYLAVHTGMARSVDHLLPERAYAIKRAEAAEASEARVYSWGILTHDFGTQRRITPAPLSYDVPVVLVVDASYFATGGDARALAEALSRTKADVIVLSGAMEDPALDPLARAGLERFREVFIK